VLEDYVTGERTLKFSLALNTLFALIVAVAALSSVLWLALGA
jgi:succinate dehydrogenase hydrophobic anchor subunit